MDMRFDEAVVAFLERNRENIFSDVDRLLRIDSVNGQAEPGAPFGAGVKAALDEVLGICAAHGLKTRCIDGSIAEAVWGEGRASLGVIAHVDIVPVGTGWTKPPLALTREGGMLFGRGVTDDKGPAVASLWALLAALHAGAALGKRIVFLFGGDEEMGMRCLRRYLETEAPPDMSFSPDSTFPVIFCEKTICHGALSARVPAGSALESLLGGTRTNVVPNEAEASLSALRAGATPPEGVSAERTAAGFTVRARGTAAHASMPEKGDNAIIRLLGALEGLLPEGDAALPAVSALRSLCAPTDGSGFGIACRDDVSGPLTFNLGVIALAQGQITAQFDIRHPVYADAKKNVLEALPQAARALGLEASDLTVRPGFDIGRDHPVVRTLMGVYNGICGTAEEPVAIGGGTYARELPNAVSYGMLFEGDPETAHMADERISEESFMKATRIYAHAIAELGK